MLPLIIALVCLALLGHAAFWMGVMNRWHAVGFPRVVVKTVLRIFDVGMVGTPLAVMYVLAQDPGGEGHGWGLDAARIYVGFCAAFGIIHIPVWARRRWLAGRLPRGVHCLQSRTLELEDHLGMALGRGHRAKAFGHVPGNQLWRMHVGEYTLDIPRLPVALEGLTICHWSDLHFSGRIDKAYYREIVEITNAMNPDLIALTGDVCDSAECIDWIVELLAPSRARLGKYFILGNHDLRTHAVGRVRSTMAQAGFTDVAGRRHLVDGGRIEIAGDERPWFKTSFEANGAPKTADRPLKLLLAHTPDRLPWAKAEDYDLMLAGHTHGGQICLPVIGPLVCPSRHGVKYAEGFFNEPPTLLHVSRGTGSLVPLRLNCTPEFTKLALHKP